MWPSASVKNLPRRFMSACTGILVLVEALGRGVPDIDLGALDRLALPVAEPRIDEQRRARRRRAHDRAAVRRHAANACARTDRAGWRRSRSGRVAVVEQAHERRDAERARDQHAPRCASRCSPCRAPPRSSAAVRNSSSVSFELAHEVVHVADERAHDLLEARVRRALQFLQHRRGDVFLPFDDH